MSKQIKLSKPVRDITGVLQLKEIDVSKVEVKPGNPGVQELVDNNSGSPGKPNGESSEMIEKKKQLLSVDSVSLGYESAGDWKRLSDPLSLMPDLKENIVRGTYKGVLSFTWKKNRVFFRKRAWPPAEGGA
jgi:hypothetical protein